MHPAPYAFYRRLAVERPFYRDAQLGLWIASGGAEVAAVLADPACRVRPAAEPVPAAFGRSAAADVFGRLVRMTDGPRHAAMRPPVQAMLAPLAGPRLSIEAARWARRLADERLQDVAGRAAGAAGVTPFAFALSGHVIASLLGVPDAEVEAIAAHGAAFARAMAPGAGPDAIDRGARAAGDLRDAFGDLLRRQGFEERGRDDSFSPILANAIGFFSQAHDATAGLIGNTLLALARQPELRAIALAGDGVRTRGGGGGGVGARDGIRAADDAANRHGMRAGAGDDDAEARAEADALPRIIAEVLRHDPPVHNTRRFVAQSTRIAGQALQAGDAILLLLAAANHDPAMNPDPARVDITRPQRRTFTFGAGPHACPGETLAIAIAAAGVRALLARGLRISELPPPDAYYPSLNIRIPVWHAAPDMPRR